jgi:hypothetical protein
MAGVHMDWVLELLTVNPMLSTAVSLLTTSRSSRLQKTPYAAGEHLSHLNDVMDRRRAYHG